MGKSFHTVTLKIINSWWLRGHLIVFVIAGLVILDQIPVNKPIVRKEITFEKTQSTRVSGGYGGKIIITPTVKSIPKSISTVVSKIITPTISPIRGSNFPSCFYNITQYYGQNGEQGDDFGCGFHTLIPALWSGTVIAGEKTCWNVYCTSTSGGVIAINSYIPGLGTETTYYLHIDSLYPGIYNGKRISKGQIIAYSGGQIYGGHWNADPQFSGGPHLEIGFSAWFLCQPDYHIRCSGINVNPYQYIKEAL